jgi:glycosyltransferase involved in cell wall biosynthesis
VKAEGANPESTMGKRKLLLLLAFAEDDTKMASVRWKRFRKHLSPEAFPFEWVPVRLPFCAGSASGASKALRELIVLHHAARYARRLAPSGRPPGKMTVLASIPTLDPLYVGAMLKKARPTDTELVLEVRDVYARPEAFAYHSLRRRWEVFKEALLIRYVDRFIFLTDEIKRRYRAYYPNRPRVREGTVITNGYDPQEYGSLSDAEARGGLLEIGYFGSFYGSRNPELLFRTLALLRRRDSVRAASIRLHLWGEAGDYPLEQKIAEYALRDTVVYHGIGAHDDIIRKYPGTSVNLIITHRTGSSYALPGKLFEYIGARRPIWAITEDQILRDFITCHRLGYLSFHHQESIAETLSLILSDHARVGGLPCIDRLENFEIPALTRRLEMFLGSGAVL